LAEGAGRASQGRTQEKKEAVFQAIRNQSGAQSSASRKRERNNGLDLKAAAEQEPGQSQAQ
jgi:hypothetical protein